MKQIHHHRVSPTGRLYGKAALQPQKGTSLIEVMVSVLLLSIGLIGSTQLITSAIKEQSALRYRVVATSIAQGLAERMRANSQGVLGGQYVDMQASGVVLSTPRNYGQARAIVASQVSPPLDANCCTNATTLAAWDVDSVEASLRTSLPKAALSLRIPVVASAPITHSRWIVIGWVEPIFDVSSSTASGASATAGGTPVILDDANNGCPAGFNSVTSTARENVRCFQYRFQL